METTNLRHVAKKRAVIYLSLVLGVCYILGLLAFYQDKGEGKAFIFLQKGFTAFPILAALCTRLLTKDKSSWNIDFRVWKNKKMLMFSALLPGAAVLAGAFIYYIFYPTELYGNVHSLYNFCSQYGLPAGIAVNAGTVIITVIVLWLISVFAIPIHLLELGEEIGWRGYLLPQFLGFMSVKRSVILNGALWGLAHAPLIYFGFNYGNGYWGAPYTGIFLMVVFCVGVGIWMSYTMVKTNNCMYAAIIHGAINVAADMQILSVVVNRPLLGAAPTGIIGMSIILIISVFLVYKMPKEAIHH